MYVCVYLFIYVKNRVAGVGEPSIHWLTLRGAEMTGAGPSMSQEFGTPSCTAFPHAFPRSEREYLGLKQALVGDTCINATCSGLSFYSTLLIPDY